MPSSFSPYNRFTKQATGENTNTWGIILNVVLDLVDFAIAGVTTISDTGETTLTSSNGVADQARAAILNYTGATAGTLVIPSSAKIYQVRSATAALTISNGSNSLTIVAGDSATIWTDGTNIRKVQSADFAGRKITNLAAPTSNLDAATKKYVDDTAFESIANFPGQTGNAGKFITTDGTTPSWGPAVAPFDLVTTTYQAVVNDRILADTTGGAFTITLPAAPADGDEIRIADGGFLLANAGWALNNLTIARNGSTIMELAEDLTCGVRGAGFTLTYKDSTWRVTP